MEKKPFDFDEFTHVVFALNNASDKSPYPHEVKCFDSILSHRMSDSCPCDLGGSACAHHG